MAEQGPESFIALAGAVGTDLDSVYSAIESGLRRFDYAAIKVHLAGCLSELPAYSDIEKHPHDLYLDRAMDAGDDLRKRALRNDIVALLGIGKIYSQRNLREPHERRAFVIRSLKHPEEVGTLREVYGSHFYLIAAYTPRERRRDRLADKVAQDNPGKSRSECEASADRIMERDQAEPGMPHGQNLQDTFHLADCFVNASTHDRMQCEIGRFLNLVFGHPFLTPTRAEHAMFHAQAAALRSAEPGRQVGAAITDRHGNVLALGANEVPRPGGGQVWRDDPKSWEASLPHEDPSETHKRKLVGEVLTALQSAKWLNQDLSIAHVDHLVERALFGESPVFVKGSRIRSLIEFGTAVHAEMAAIDDAACRGTSIQGGTMYITTFPCHLCARHIIAAGVLKVRYIEPYPKSLATDLYPGEIDLEPSEIAGPAQKGNAVEKVAFAPFLGVAPRQYLRLFRSPMRKDGRGNITHFVPHTAQPRGLAKTAIYLEGEKAALTLLESALGKS